MAEVLAPIIQQSGSMTMLHTPTDAFQQNPQNQSHHRSHSSHTSRPNQMPRSQYNNTQGGATVGYRGTSAAPVAPYAFSATPQLRQEHRTTSAPSVPVLQQGVGHPNVRQWHPSHVSSASDSTASTASSNRSHHGIRDDGTPSSQTSTSSKIGNGPQRLLDTGNNMFSSSVPDLSLGTFDANSKPSPDRYRRNARRSDSNNSVGSVPQGHPQNMNRSTMSAMPSGSGMATVAHLYNNAQPPNARQNRPNSVDDLHVPRQISTDQAKRYRRRSLGAFDGDILANAPQFVPPVSKASEMPPTKRQGSYEGKASPKSDRPNSHARGGSQESVTSNRPSSRASSRPSSRQEAARPGSSAGPRADQRQVNIPPRGSSDANKRLTPSPLSKPIASAEPDSPQKPSTTSADPTPSPAVQRLTALNDGKADNKGMKSRLRRAFSFGSAAELRRATAENNITSERARLQKDRPQDELDPEDAAIAAKQEAAGIGAGIYSGQGGFSGSTDNLSISSTASSASIMLRKMGKGMKKGGRSIKGLFRPKSVIGVPAADSAVTQPSLAQVSMVTVEAEREKVNVNADPHEQVGGGTAYPKLERNSLDASALAEAPRPSSTRGQAIDTSSNRKSIMGGDRERAEVLASIKKGILKRPGANSPVIRPVDGNQHAETPVSSVPSTPRDDNARTIHLPLTEDYFNGVARPGNSSTKSLPNTPRNISFSPRIQFHDAFSSSEYDRRGDIATCNRLTPMLAQQIKEELNSFKMEMEVHELSKPHTHFF